MSQTGAVARLALRELWISFRLLLLLVVFVGAGAVSALLPGAASARGERLVIGVCVALLVAAVVAAWSAALERRTGRAGWLVARSVPRGTIIAGWFLAVAGSLVVGLAAAGALGWLAVSAAAPSLDPARFALGVAVLGAIGLAGVALGLLLGMLLPPRVATMLLLAAGAAGIALAVGRTDLGTWLVAPATTTAELVRLAGLLLASTAALLTLTLVAIGRVEL